MASRRKYRRQPPPSLWPINTLLLILLALLGAFGIWIATGGLSRLG